METGWGWSHTWSLVWEQLFTPRGTLLEAIIKTRVKTVLKHYSIIFFRPERRGGGAVWVQAARAHRWDRMAGVWCSGKELRGPWVWFGTPKPGSLRPLPVLQLPLPCLRLKLQQVWSSAEPPARCIIHPRALMM